MGDGDELNYEDRKAIAEAQRMALDMDLSRRKASRGDVRDIWGRVLTLMEQVADMEERVFDLTHMVYPLDYVIGDMAAEIGKFREQVAALEGAVADQGAQLEALRTELAGQAEDLADWIAFRDSILGADFGEDE